MTGNNFLNVLGINIFAADDQQVFLPAHNVELALPPEPEVAGVIPAIDDRLRGEIGAVVVTLEQAVALNQNLADVAVVKNCARIRDTMRTS